MQTALMATDELLASSSFASHGLRRQAEVILGLGGQKSDLVGVAEIGA